MWGRYLETVLVDAKRRCLPHMPHTLDLSPLGAQLEYAWCSSCKESRGQYDLKCPDFAQAQSSVMNTHCCLLLERLELQACYVARRFPLVLLASWAGNSSLHLLFSLYCKLLVPTSLSKFRGTAPGCERDDRSQLKLRNFVTESVNQRLANLSDR